MLSIVTVSSNYREEDASPLYNTEEFLVFTVRLSVPWYRFHLQFFQGTKIPIVLGIFLFRKSMTQIFFVVSFGSSGSWSLCKHLQRFGKAFHVHSRLPPTCLTSLGGRYDDGTKVYREWFGDSNLSKQDYERSKVIFVLREPRSAYLSIVRVPWSVERPEE